MGERPASRWYQAAFGAHYPLLYQHRDEAEAERCLVLLPKLAPLGDDSGAPILDLGCGDGRHLAWLKEAGQSVVGLDLSPHLLARAGDRQPALPLVQADMQHLPFVDQSLASVLSLFTAFGYFGPPADNEGPVREIARVMRRGGHWFLDYFDGDRVLAELGDGQARTRERELDCLRIKEVRRYHADRQQVCKEVALQAVPGREPEAAAYGIGPDGLFYTEQVAVFRLAEFDELAAGQGLTRVAAAGGYEGQRLGAGTRWILVYRKERDPAT